MGVKYINLVGIQSWVELAILFGIKAYKMRFCAVTAIKWATYNLFISEIKIDFVKNIFYSNIRDFMNMYNMYNMNM